MATATKLREIGGRYKIQHPILHSQHPKQGEKQSSCKHHVAVSISFVECTNLVFCCSAFLPSSDMLASHMSYAIKRSSHDFMAPNDMKYSPNQVPVNPLPPTPMSMLWMPGSSFCGRPVTSPRKTPRTPVQPPARGAFGLRWLWWHPLIDTEKGGTP